MRRGSKATVAGAGTAAAVAAAGWAAPKLATGAAAAAPRRRRSARASTRRCTSTTGCRRTTEAPIYVVEHGDGPPIVLSHGVTLSVRTWFHQLELLPKEGFRTIAFDHRGHGESELGESGHSLDNLAEDVRSVVLGLDLHDAILVGHSMGGVAVQLFALRHPELARERVRGIVLLSTLAKTPLGSRSTQMKDRMERCFNRVPDSTLLWERKNLGFLARATRLRQRSAPESRRARPAHDCSRAHPKPAGHAPRVLVGLDLAGRAPEYRASRRSWSAVPPT